MAGPGNKRSTLFINLFLILLVLVLIYALYRISGGDLLAWIRPGIHTGDDPISQLVGSLRAFGQGLRDSFGGILR